MEKKYSQNFDDKNSLYILIYNFIANNNFFINGDPPSSISKNNVRNYIKFSSVFVNKKPINKPNYKVSDGDEILLADIDITITCR